MTKLILFFLFNLTPLAFSLDGREFSDCFEKAFNTSIENYKKYALKNPKSFDVETSRLCNKLSAKDYERIKSDFVEWDEENKVEVPYDEEDMHLSKIGDLSAFLALKVNCYKAYTSGQLFIHKMINSVPRKRNSYLVDLTLSLMTKEKSPKNSEKLLGDSDLSFCFN